MERKPVGTSVGLLFLLVALCWTGAARAQVVKESSSSLESLAFVSERLRPSQALERLEDVQSVIPAEVGSSWQSFLLDNGGTWQGYVDARNGRVVALEGSGIPWVPGRGNGLAKAKVDLATVESVARAFLPKVAHLLGVDPASLVLNQGRSGQPAEHVWFVDFDVVRDGLTVEGARVVFRVNNGNLIQFGSENLTSDRGPAPRATVAREQALAALAAHIGGFSAADAFLDGGSLRLLPVALVDDRFAEGFAFGQGRGVTPAWQFTFH